MAEPGDRNSNEYDRAAEAQGWRGPEVVFGLSYAFLKTGDSVLDIGIGTGRAAALFQKAGLCVHGMDISPDMVNICRAKGVAVELKEHDLRVEPYPYPADSMDHAACVGVLNFFRDPGPVFREAGRILRGGGIFAFMVGDRAAGERAEMKVDSQHTDNGASVTMFRHGADEIDRLLRDSHFTLLRSLGFSVPMNRERSSILPARAYVARRIHRT